jgi:ABC-2 type transport system ATP-binding protein
MLRISMAAFSLIARGRKDLTFVTPRIRLHSLWRPCRDGHHGTTWNRRHSVLVAQLQSVVKTFGAVRALDGLDLEVRAGELLALLGPNGAGKTTAIHVLLGLLAPDAGQVLIDGLPVSAGNRESRAAMFQSAALPEVLTVRELVDYARSGVRQPRTLQQCVELGGLEALLARRYGQLSGGEQRRVQFALALATRPRLLFLDEPSNAMDREARQRLFHSIDSLRADGCSILLTTHVLEEVESRADRLLLIRAGKAVLEGRPAEIRNRMGVRLVEARSTLDAATIARFGDIELLAAPTGWTRLRTREAEHVVRQWLGADPHLTELSVQPLKLEDVLGTYEKEAA